VKTVDFLGISSCSLLSGKGRAISCHVISWALQSLLSDAPPRLFRFLPNDSFSSKVKNSTAFPQWGFNQFNPSSPPMINKTPIRCGAWLRFALNELLVVLVISIAMALVDGAVDPKRCSRRGTNSPCSCLASVNFPS
jgi:hypothetical protein